MPTLVADRTTLYRVISLSQCWEKIIRDAELNRHGTAKGTGTDINDSNQTLQVFIIPLPFHGTEACSLTKPDESTLLFSERKVFVEE